MLKPTYVNRSLNTFSWGRSVPFQVKLFKIISAAHTSKKFQNLIYLLLKMYILTHGFKGKKNARIGYEYKKLSTNYHVELMVRK